MLSEIFNQKYMQIIQQPFSNVQLELLKTFSYQLADAEILELRKVLASFFAQRAIRLANQKWDEEKWNEETVDKLLNTKMRKKKPKTK